MKTILFDNRRNNVLAGLFIIITGTFFNNNVSTAAITSNGAGGGNWSAGGTWVGGIPPGLSDDAVIADGDVVNVDVTSSCNKLTITANGTAIDFTQLIVNSAVTLTVVTDVDFSMSNSANATLTLSGSGLSQLLIAGNFTNFTVGGTATFSFATSSRVRYNGGSGSSTIIAANYGLLLSTGAGARVLASSGTIGIATSFTPGTNSYTITGSTINFNGTAAATIPAFNYNNLTSSSTGGRTLASSGTIGIAGTFTPGTNAYTVTGSTVDFNAAGAQTVPALPGSVNYNNITASVSGTKSLGASTGITGTLTVSGTATFAIAGFTFTLVSDASGTASIAAIPAGADVTGNITMQRFTPAGNTNWRFLGSAASGRTIADWTDDFATSGFTGANCGPADCANPICAATCTFVSVYTYDEQVGGVKDNGYVAATNVTNPLTVGKGFWVYYGPTPITFDVTGPPNKGSIALPATYTVSGGASEDGWNVVCNPYPSAISWDDADWTKTNINSTIYIYSPAVADYASYTGNGACTGASVNGGSCNIASQQAFWIQASGAPTLTAAEGVKAAANPTFLKTNNSKNISHIPMAFQDFPIPQNANNILNSILFTASVSGYPDNEMMIRFMQGATSNFDGQYDAWDLKGDYTNLSSVITGNLDLAVNSLPDLTANVDIPIRLTIPAGSGTPTYSIRRDSILMIPLSSCLILEDLVTSTMTDLRTNISYSFTISDTTAAPRFILHVYAPITKQAVHVTCPGGTNGMAVATGTGTGPWNYTWKDSLGNVLQTTLASSTADTLFNLSAAIYTVEVSGSACGIVTDTIMINAPAAITSSFSQTNVSCFGGNDGTAAATVTGGTSPYLYLWSDGQTTASAASLSSGSYTLTVTDANGCAAASTVSISQPLALTTSMSVTNASSCTASDGSATANVSSGTPPYGYSWNPTSQTTQTATGLAVDTFVVTITDANNCVLTDTAVVNCLTGVNPYSSQTSFVVYPNPNTGMFNVQWLMANGNTSIIEIYNVLGEIIFISTINHKTSSIDLSDKPNGIYFLRLKSENGIETQKLVIEK